VRLRLRPLALTRLALFVAFCALLAPVAAGAGTVKFFHSPSKNIQCEVRTAYAYCQTFTPLRSVKLAPAGTYKVCNGVNCVGDGPLDAFTLAYGRSVNVGPFRCTSLRSGMKCVVARTSHGFVISRAGVTRV
jgi:hypothetical protein